MGSSNDLEDLFLSGWSLMLGTFLIIAPWYLGFTADRTPCWNAWACGSVVVILSLLALARVHDWLEFLTAAIGLWLCAAPWALGFDANMPAAWSHAGFGFSLMIAAFAELWRLREARTSGAIRSVAHPAGPDSGRAGLRP